MADTLPPKMTWLNAPSDTPGDHARAWAKGWNDCLAATKAAAPADAPSDALLHAGDLMANTMFNLAQRAGYAIDSDLAAKFDKMRKQWDAARRASSVPAIPGTGREKEWISVTDKLPDPNGTYLVASNWGVRAAYLHDPAWAQGCWQDALSKTDEGEMDFDYKQKGRFKVTHWMPLPDAPSHPSEAKAGEPGNG